MEGKKRYVAIILFLLICLMLFTFATTGEEELETGKGNDTNIQEVTNKGDSEKDKETEKENSNGSNTGSTGSSNNGNSNAGDDEDLEGTGNTDNSAWDNALKAVEELEKLLTDDQLNIARELVEEITNSDQYKELIERVEDAEDAIDATALVEALEKMVEEAAKKEDINDTSDFRDEEVLDSINDIDGEYLNEVKEELLKRVEELNKILDDETAPTVEGIKDGDKTKEDVELTITDDNEVTTTVTKDGKTYDNVEKFTEEGTYEVTVVDSAFNETKLTFTIDKTAIAVQSANMYSNGKKHEVGKDVYYYATKGQKITAYVRLKEQSATLPTITLTIDGKEYVLENVKESFHNKSDKENNIYKYEGTFTIPEDMEVASSEVSYKVTNITDEAGNETTVSKVTNKNIVVVDTINPKFENLALVGGKGYWFDKEYKQYATNGTIVYVNVRFKEKLATTPVVTLNDTVKLTKPGTVKEDKGLWIYSYSYRLTEGDGLVDGTLNVKVTNIADLAGNSIELTNADCKMESQSEIIVDRQPITIEGIEATEYTYDGVGVTPSTSAEDVKSVELTKDGQKVDYELGNAIVNAGSYKLTVTDLAGNKTTKEFVINKKQLEFDLSVEEVYEYAGNEIQATINVTNAESTDVYEIDDRYYIMNDKGQFMGPLTVDYAKDLGTYKVKVVIKSTSENYADSETKSLTFKVVDTTAPTITLPFPMGKETYEYRIESGTEVTLEDIMATVTDNYDETTTIKPYKADLLVGKASENTYNYDLSKGIDTRQIGRYNIYYTYTDKSGNVANVTLLLFMKDTTPATITLPGTEGRNQNEYIVEAGTEVTLEDVLATVTDNVDPESKLEPYKADLLIGGKEDNIYNYDFSNGFDTKYSGRYNVYYTYTDKAGHVTNKTMLLVMKDTVAPTLEITEKGNMVYVRGKDVTRLKYTVKKDGKSVHTVDSATCGCGNYFSITWLAKTYGDGEYTIEVVDAGGNKATAKAIVDTTAPTYKFYKEGSSLDKDEIQPVVVDGKLYFNQNVRVRFVEETTYFTQYIHNDFVNNENKTTIKTWTREAKTNGKHTMKVTDAKGNVTEVTFYIDKTVPTLTVKDESVGTDPVYSKVSFKLSDNEKVDYVMVNGNKFDVSNAKYSDANYDNIKKYLVEGENTVVLYDIAGNSTSKTFTMDWTAPEALEYTQKYDATENGVKVTVTFNEAIKSVDEGWTKIEDNKYSKVFTSSEEHTITFKDLAGNKGTYTFSVDATPNRVTQTFYRGDKIIDKTFYVKNGDKIQFNIGFSEKLGEDAVITIGGKKVELTYERYFEATKSHMYYGYLEVAEDETELVEGELEISISNITDEVGNPGFYYQTNGKKVMASYKNVLTTNGHKVVYDNTANRVTQTFFRGDVTEGKMNYVTNGSKIQFNIGFSEKLSEDMVITIGGKEVEMTYERYVVATKSHMYYGYLEVTEEDNFEEGILEIKISNITDFVGNKGFYYQTNGKKVYQELTQDKCTNAEQVFYDVTGPEVTPSYTETTTEQDEEFTNFPTFEVKDNSNQSVTEELISGSVDTTKLGCYKLTYRFTDIVGNYTDVTVTVKVVDTTAPVITGITDGAYYNTKDTHAIPSAYDKNGAVMFIRTELGDLKLTSFLKNEKEIKLVGTYKVWAVDPFGNKSEEITIHIDPYAPKVLVLDRIENVSGAYLPIKPVILEHNLDTITVTLNGKTIDFKEGDQLTKDGKYVMTVTDKANNSTTVEFTMDSVAPTMMISPTSLGVVDSLDLNDADNITGLLLSEDADFQLMKVEKNITVLGKEIPIYKYTKLPEDGIIDEEGQYIIIAYDKAYNVTAYKFIVDRSAPTVNVEEGKYYSSATINVEDANMASGSLEELKDLIPGLGSIISSISKLDPSITIKEENDLLKTTIENGYVVDEDGTYTLVAKDVIGVNPLFSKEEQAAHTTTVTFHIDTKKPTANVVEGGVYKKVTVSVEDAHLDEESITINGKKYDGKEITEEGNYVLEAKDLAGNTLTVNFEVNKTPITISGVEEGEFYNTNKVVEVTSKDENATVKLNGAVVEKEMTVSTEGENTILVTDKWGNTEEVTFTIDKTAPTIKHNFETNNITKGVKGTETLDVKALVEDNIDSDKYIDPVITHSTKDVNEVIISKEYIGTYTLTYNAKDTAGNKAEQVVVTIEVIIDDYVVSFVDVDGKNFTYTYGDTISSFEATIYSAELDEYVTLEDGDITFDKVSSDFVNAGTYKVTATPNTTKYPGAKAVSQNITINKKAVTVTFAKSNGTETVDSYEFDGNKNPFKIVGVDGVLAGEEVTATVSYGKCDFGIGSCTATAKLDSDNYTITNPTHKFTIKQANATVTLPTTITGKVTIVNGEGQTIPNEYATIVISEKHTAKGTQNITTEDYTSPECVWNWKKLDYVCPEITNTYEVAIKYQTIQVISNEYMIVPNTEGKINGDSYIKQASQIANALGVTVVEEVYEQVKTAMPTTGTSGVYITETPSVDKVTE